MEKLVPGPLKAGILNPVLKNQRAIPSWTTTAASEQLKCSGPVIIDSITKLVNKILQEKFVPGPLKAGILTSVLKKSKDPTKLYNYPGISHTNDLKVI